MKPAVRIGAAMVSIGLALLAAGCGGGGGGGTGTGPGPAAPPVRTAASTAPPTSRYQSFDQVPGPTITHRPSTLSGDTLTVDVKPMKTAWTAQFQSEPADAGTHFLVVHMALTPTAEDRGLRGVSLKEVTVRYADPAITQDTCPDGRPRPAGGYCYADLQSTGIVSELIPLAGDWETHQFASREYTGTDLVPSVAYAGVGAYEIPDDLRAPGGFQLCGADHGTGSKNGKAPRLCIPLDTPARPRG